ncbi:MAG: hypothetical protein DCF25_15620 [Leptolyngbya foveolarum]|uniref:Uncharacterized protein n=1 Tax=Leptolyngbya foveolarum TaxID=47253 RepID=A0A2W4VNP2_9CYAN|nr:MAG: hypothetical protein DCF25_15620 [Leptolyngbya foveolarum]
MAMLTIEIPDDLMEQLSPVKEQIPELLRRCLHPLALPAQVYRYVLDFLTSQPTPEQIADFRPTAEMQSRLKFLVEKELGGALSQQEQLELSEYEQIEHLIIMFKAGTIGRPQQAIA